MQSFDQAVLNEKYMSLLFKVLSDVISVFLLFLFCFVLFGGVLCLFLGFIVFCLCVCLLNGGRSDLLVCLEASFVSAVWFP